MDIVLDQSDIRLAMISIANHLKSELNESYQDYSIAIPSTYGQGIIKGISLIGEMNLFLLDLYFKEEVTFIFRANKNLPYRVVYNLQGNISHLLADNEFQYNIQAYSGSISACPTNSSQSFIFKANNNVKFAMLEVSREKNLSKEDQAYFGIPPAFFSMLTDSLAENSFLYQNKNSSPTAESVKKMFSDDQSGYFKKISQTIRALQMIFYEVKKYKSDFFKAESISSINSKDLEALYRAREMLVADLSGGITIKELAIYVGMSETKLKRIFKVVFNQTIYQYLLQERMSRAALLLMDSRYNISQISLMLGYSNPSGFIKQFKSKYGITPKLYQKYNYSDDFTINNE